MTLSVRQIALQGLSAQLIVGLAAVQGLQPLAVPVTSTRGPAIHAFSSKRAPAVAIVGVRAQGRTLAQASVVSVAVVDAVAFGEANASVSARASLDTRRIALQEDEEALFA